ncbi:DNA-binding protein [Staphylococcus pseudoxylosus]|uniref:DNA-binding protein n=1 Tax=Staphylococcus pseudoxylosus TaxID=2282419 RepID=UPI000D1D50E1|nr:DNA-binding protein [Staphylococcus pseudoxylosus]PTI46167.1 DNA-binding protein [Staphylococcus xylosus]MDW8797957.1 DNA-binding protein [Staphylococcus pseudoxylosus]MEB6036756.1 DNA-binding protein [Staphylococcus pseudoxylosus]MEB6043902.1 DNA-binding protein [Staphylococcus pseudoxylosus]MEB6060672.1 DNA-binding protein [Staphylococcus pseudoxylosus]
MSTDLPKIGKPATNALHNLGVKSLEAVSKYERTTLLGIHGVGPKAIELLEEALKANDLNFKNETNFEVPFELTGDLSCDNAPKRRTMLTFIIASATVDKKKLSNLVTNDFVWEVPGSFKLEGFDDFYKELEDHQVNIASLEVKDNLSHGKVGAIHGTQIAQDGSIVYFTDIFKFESHSKDAKVKAITSYIIMNEGES